MERTRATAYLRFAGEIDSFKRSIAGLLSKMYAENFTGASMMRDCEEMVVKMATTVEQARITANYLYVEDMKDRGPADDDATAQWLPWDGAEHAGDA